MEREEILVLSNVVIAFATFVGIGGAFFYYMRSLDYFSTADIFLVEIVYVLIGLIVISIAKDKMKKEGKENEST